MDLPEGGVTLTFNASNWAEPQSVQLLDGPAVLPEGEYDAAFSVTLAWAVVGGDGSAGTRTRTLTGVYRLNTPGTSFANPALVDSLPWATDASLAQFSPANAFLANAEGPFLPNIFVRYTAPEAQGIVFTVCPEQGANYQPRGFIYDDAWAYYSLLPQLALAPDAYGCQAQVAILDAGQSEQWRWLLLLLLLLLPACDHEPQACCDALDVDLLDAHAVLPPASRYPLPRPAHPAAYFLVAAPSNLFTVPGAAAGLAGNMLLDVQAISVAQVSSRDRD